MNDTHRAAPFITYMVSNSRVGLAFSCHLLYPPHRRQVCHRFSVHHCGGKGEPIQSWHVWYLAEVVRSIIVGLLV